MFLPPRARPPPGSQPKNAGQLREGLFATLHGLRDLPVAEIPVARAIHFHVLERCDRRAVDVGESGAWIGGVSDRLPQSEGGEHTGSQDFATNARQFTGQPFKSLADVVEGSGNDLAPMLAVSGLS